MKSSAISEFSSCAVLAISMSACTANDVFSGARTMSDGQCLRSESHTLHRTDDGYVCLPAVSVCEDGFAQGSDKPSVCTAISGCTYVPGDCYCPPDPNVICICGGGEPPQCIWGGAIGI